jgi:hypothetical protein
MKLAAHCRWGCSGSLIDQAKVRRNLCGSELMSEIFPRGHVVFCDDIRHEQGNKPSFMGVYVQDMFVGVPFPTALPKFFAFVTYVDSIVAPHGNATIQLFLPGDADDKPSATTEIPMLEMAEKANKKTTTGRDATKLVIHLELQMVPFAIKEAGFVRVVAVHADDTLELGKLEVASSPLVPAAEPRPSKPDETPGN